MWTNGVPSIHGVPVAITNAIAAGSFLVGNFSMGAEIKQRQGLGVRFFEETLAANNQVLVVIEERLALPIYYPSAFLYDTFADGIADLTAP
jgi:HK97 family phage major capsid protein